MRGCKLGVLVGTSVHSRDVPVATAATALST